MKSSKLAVVGIAGALLVGAGGGFVMSMASGASAEPSATSATDPGTPTSPTETDDDSDNGASIKHDRGRGFQPLVDDGTITAAERDSLVAALTRSP